MRMLIVAMTSALLAGCGGEADVSVTNASPEEVANRLAASGDGNLGLRPGRWESKVELVSVDAPGLPPEALETMRSAFASSNESGVASCLTAEEAKKPAADFFTGSGGNECRYETFELGGGKLDSKLNCKGAELAMNGTYSAEDFAMTMTTKTETARVAEGAPQMNLTMQVKASRTGDCDGTENA